MALAHRSHVLVLVAALAVMTLCLGGCDSPSLPDVPAVPAVPAGPDFDKIKRDVRKEWDRIAHNEHIQKMTDQAGDAFRSLEDATKDGAKDLQKKAMDEVAATMKALYTSWKSSTTHVDHYEIPPKCLLAMAVGGGAVTAASGLALAALGFAAEGVEELSLAALWQSSLGDVEAGSLFARLQSLGAKGLSLADHFAVTGVFATISACFCGVVNQVCHHCISDASAKVFLPQINGTQANRTQLWF